MTNLEIAVTFLKMAASGEVDLAYEKFVDPNFIHHNQYFKGDRQSLLDAMKSAHQSSPNKEIVIKHKYECGPTIITHSLVLRQDQSQPSIAVVHIFKIENSKIKELWDVGQMIDPKSLNENGLF